MGDPIPEIQLPIGKEHIEILGALYEPEKIGKVKVPTRTAQDAVNLITSYWSATQPSEEAQRIIDFYEGLDTSHGGIEGSSQFTSPLGNMRTLLGRRRSGEPDTIEFPYYVMIMGNGIPLNDPSLNWLKNQGFISATELPVK